MKLPLLVLKSMSFYFYFFKITESKMIVKILMTKPLPSLDTGGIVTQKSFGTFEKQILE